MSNKKNYGYFGEGAEGYAHYMQSFEENFSSDETDSFDDSYDSYREKYHTDLNDELSDEDDDWDDNEEEDEDYWDDEEEELPTMTIDGTITLCPEESEYDFMMKFEEFLAENGWSFDGLTMDD